MPSPRSKNGYDTQISQFIKDVLVICPKCEGQALVKTTHSPDVKITENSVRLICSSCGFNKIQSEKPKATLVSTNYKSIKGNFLVVGSQVDPFFKLPLWLTEPFNEHLFWAYNKEHLCFLEQHIQAKLRERNTDKISNRSIASRLPRWMTSKKNRASLLKIIEKLKQKV